MTPPPGFRAVAHGLVEGSAALVPLVVGDAPRGLVAAFIELDAPDPATLAVGKVDRALEVGPTVRAAAASVIAAHFRAELDLEVVVDRPSIVLGSTGPRLEARAHTRAGGGLRTVRFAFVPASRSHLVLAASYPAEREVELEQRLRRAFDSVVPEIAAPNPMEGTGAARIALFGGSGAAAAVFAQRWRRRRARGR